MEQVIREEKTMTLLLTIIILLLLLSGIYFGFIAINKPQLFGFKGASFYYFGRRIWKFTNRLFGLLLLAGTLLFSILLIKDKHLLTMTEGSKQIGLIVIYVVLAFVTTDVLAFIIMYQKKKKKRKIKQFWHNQNLE